MKSLEDCSDLQLHRCAEIHGVVDGVGWGGFFSQEISGKSLWFVMESPIITNNHNHNDSNINHQLLVIIGDYWWFHHNNVTIIVIVIITIIIIIIVTGTGTFIWKWRTNCNWAIPDPHLSTFLVGWWSSMMAPMEPTLWWRNSCPDVWGHSVGASDWLPMDQSWVMGISWVYDCNSGYIMNINELWYKTINAHYICGY